MVSTEVLIPLYMELKYDPKLLVALVIFSLFTVSPAKLIVFNLLSKFNHKSEVLFECYTLAHINLAAFFNAKLHRSEKF